MVCFVSLSRLFFIPLPLPLSLLPLVQWSVCVFVSTGTVIHRLECTAVCVYAFVGI